MSKILIVENDQAWGKDFKEILSSVFGETAEIQVIGLADEARQIIKQIGFFDDVELILADLELEAGTDIFPGDYLGRDLVLKEIREHACWVPIILVSRYIKGDLAILAEITPYDFDAVIPKMFFTEQKTNRKQWEDLRYKAEIKRAATMTGRGMHQVLTALDKEIEFEWGGAVEEYVNLYGRDRFDKLMRLIGLGAPRIVFDEVVLGFSGLTLVKATCRRGNDSTEWLLKFGTAIQKLDQEARAHRRMFEDGFTRNMSVPLFWWKPIVWRSIGMIAYEFEKGAETFLSRLRSEDDKEKTLTILTPVLEELYRGTEVDSVIPRKYLARVTKDLETESDKDQWGGTVSAILSNSKSEKMDDSVRVLVGCEHGDLHGRNIMVGKKGPVLIDFAHYLGPRDKERGIPLIDLAKLFVDLTVFGALNIEFDELLSGKVFDRPRLSNVIRPFLVDKKTGLASSNERTFFTSATACFLALYSRYKDVPTDKREEIGKALLRSS